MPRKPTSTPIRRTVPIHRYPHLQQAYLAMLQADYAYCELPDAANNTQINRTQATYYKLLAIHLRNNYPPPLATLERARNLRSRAQQNRLRNLNNKHWQELTLYRLRSVRQLFMRADANAYNYIREHNLPANPQPPALYTRTREQRAYE